MSAKNNQAGLDVADCCVTLDEARDVIRRQERRIAELNAVLVQADAGLCHMRAECLRLSRENVELKRGAPLERVLSPNDSRVTDYTD